MVTVRPETTADHATIRAVHERAFGGGAVEVLAPEALRLSAADRAEQMVKRYR